MRVNLASGTHPFPGWWNVDLNDHPDVDERVDLLAGLGSVVDVELAYVGHFLEHLTPHECVDFLTRTRGVMRPGGRIVVVGPDIDRAQLLFEDGLLSPDLFAAIKPHGLRHGNDVSHIHEWVCTGTEVREMLERAGFGPANDLDWPAVAALGVPVISDAPWQLAVTAVAGDNS